METTSKNKVTLLFLMASSLIIFSATIVCTLFASTQSPFFNVYGSCSACSGNHYYPADDGIKHDFTTSGGKEFWTCCKCHRHYTDVFDIPGYNTKNWKDASLSKPVFDSFGDDDRVIKKGFNDVFAESFNNFGFSSNLNNVVRSNSKSGYILSTSDFYDINFTVRVNQSSSYNPYSDHNVRNSILIGSSVDGDGKLYGYAIDICSSFIDVFYLYGSGTINHAGNSIAYYSGDFSNKNLKISLSGGHLTVKDGDIILINQLLAIYGYQDSGVYVGDIWYKSGKIGFLNFDSENASCSFSIISSDSVFQNYSLSSNTISSNSNNGYMINDQSYKNVNFTVCVNQSSSYNPYSDHNVRNSILIGSSVDENGKLYGYAIDICSSFIDVFYLYGSGTINHAGNSIAYYSGDFSNKNLNITVTESNLVIKDGDTEVINTNLNIKSYGDGSTIIGNIAYNGGSIGFLNFDSTFASASFANLLTLEDPFDLISSQSFDNGFSISKSTNKISYQKNKDGYVLSKASYANFKALVKVSTSSLNGNCYFDHISRNAFLFGCYFDNHNVLNGYLIEFYKDFIMLFKFKGDTGFGGSIAPNTGDCICYIENNQITKEALITVQNGSISIKAMNNNGIMETIEASNLSYSGGMFGYLKHDQGQMESGYFRVSQIISL